MEKYLNETQGLLGLVQATITEAELKRSTDAGIEMWDAIKEVTDRYGLNVQEMLNATLGCHQSIMEVVNEQLIEKKKEMGL
jgi:hypothetical protein